MSTTYNLEEVKAKLPPAIEEMNTLIGTTIPNMVERARELAKETGVQQVIDDVEALAVTMGEGLTNLLKQMVGEEGDSVQTATMCGELAAAKKMDAALNGV